MKKISIRIVSMFVVILLLCVTHANVFSQKGDEIKYQTLEDLQDENLVNYTRIYRIVNDYPDFKYRYVFDDGDIKNVIVEGIDNELDRKRVKAMILDFKKNKDRMKNIPTRAGVYYSVDQEAEPEDGYHELYQILHSNIDYSQEARDWGIEGTIYLKFAIDNKGEIIYARAKEDIDTPHQVILDNLKENSVQAILETSGSWKPARVNGDPVSSWMIIPLVFEIETHPMLPAIIR
jgi:hypothetical protein